MDLIEQYNRFVKIDYNRKIVDDICKAFKAYERSTEFWLIKLFCAMEGTPMEKIKRLERSKI